MHSHAGAWEREIQDDKKIVRFTFGCLRITGKSRVIDKALNVELPVCFNVQVLHWRYGLGLHQTRQLL